jgi:hypothetical protein
LHSATWDDDEAGHDGEAGDNRSLLQRLTGQDWGDRLALGMLALVGIGIIGNALMRQTGPHPAPLFAAAVVAPTPVPVARPADVQQTASIAQRPAEPAPAAASTAAAPAQPAARSRSDLVADIQRELVRRRLYDGAVDGMTGPKTEAAIRRFETEARLPVSGEASDALLAKLKRGGPPAATAVARPQAQAPAAQPAAQPAPRAAAAAQPQGPQSIADLIGQNGRQAQAAAPRQAPTPRERSIGDLIAADAGPRRP